MKKTTETLRAELIELGHKLTDRVNAVLQDSVSDKDAGIYIHELTSAASEALEAATGADHRSVQDATMEKLVAMIEPMVAQYAHPSRGPVS